VLKKIFSTIFKKYGTMTHNYMKNINLKKINDVQHFKHWMEHENMIKNTIE
jgi:hypothetical protein